jgi:hypothetical protein
MIYLRAIIPAVLTSLFSLPLFAAEPMSADAVKDLLTNNTMNGVVLKKNRRFISFFEDDGTMVKRNAKGKLVTGAWYVNDNGEHCTDWGKGSRCGAIVDLGDNTYEKLHGGKPSVKFSVTRGNAKNL